MDSNELMQYLSEEEKKKIAERVFTEEYTKYIKEVIKNKGYPGETIDTIIKATIQDIVTELRSKYEGAVLAKIKRIIEKDDKDGVLDEEIGYTISDIAIELVKSHKEDIIDPIIIRSITRLTDKKVADIISSRINKVLNESFEIVLQDILQDMLNKKEKK